MKALILAAALFAGSAAYAQSNDPSQAGPAGTPPMTGDQSNPVPAGGGQPTATPGDSDPTPPVTNLPTSAQNNGGYQAGSQTADSGATKGPLPKCSRNVTDNCVER